MGPLGSAKTKLLKILSCLCRRSKLAADIRTASFYQMVNDPDPPTLLIDELDLDSKKPNSEILRLLRTGNTRDVPTVRNGQVFSTFCFKAISSREMPADGALASRVVTISMLPSERQFPPFDGAAMQRLRNEFQPRLEAYRLAMRARVEQFQRQTGTPCDMTPRTRQIAQVLTAPFADDSGWRDLLLAALRARDEANRLDRFGEPEWQVGEALFAMSHPLPSNPMPVRITVGAIAAIATKRLQMAGEDQTLTPRKVGAILRSLGFPTKRLGNLGRGLEFTHAVRRQIHEIARQLGIDRRMITNSDAVAAGNGGLYCQRCEETGTTGALRFKTFDEFRPLSPSGPHLLRHRTKLTRADEAR